MPIAMVLPVVCPGILSEKLYSSLPAMTPGQGVLAAIATTMFAQAARVAATGFDKYDNIDPRAQMAKLVSQESGSTHVSRAQAAHLNGFEDLAMFGAAVAVAVASGVNKEVIGKIATLHTIARMGFNFAYIFATTASQSTLRGVFFLLGFLCNLKLLALSK
eukprot:TRINITY_DN1034_c15_g1_i1.p1 TRINITY_DN1034_c15_g1~~TRINITY_DN1034_c15_g1_i1.p1  ORF type:complete len:188 (+),score=35.85 TRINITY_DN1034_c15_g1_i1:82-564(+)